MRALPAVADDNGLASAIHDVRRESGKLCQVDHWHYGSGVGATKKLAMVDAVGSWQNFTALEYGSDWARFQRAASRNVSCANTVAAGSVAPSRGVLAGNRILVFFA